MVRQVFFLKQQLEKKGVKAEKNGDFFSLNN
jgi:hypothetical protein